MHRSMWVLLLILLTAWLAFDIAQRRFEATLPLPAGGLAFEVKRGESLRRVVARLHEDGFLPNPWVARAWGRYTGLDLRIKRGEYHLPAGTTTASLLQLLARGKVVNYQVTLPEGITLARALELLHLQARLRATIETVNDVRITALVAPYSTPEGLFFPDSYQYERGASDWDILSRAHQRMQAVLTQEWSAKDEGLPYETPYDALIMASIIERETGVGSERPEIAGVFVRRLGKRMRLQTDPTVIYGLGASFDGNLRRKHLADEGNPYNTYRHNGLPPSPIALPGRAAIHAALHPEAGTSLYLSLIHI